MSNGFFKIALPCAALLIDRAVEVPGVVLMPGTYTFKLLNTTDRHIVEISSQDGKQIYAIVFTAAARRIDATATPTMTFFESKGGRPEAVHRWFWPGDLDGQEFLYPHTQAGTIAAETGVIVPEAPPAAVAETPAPVVAETAPGEETVAEVEVPQEVLDALPLEPAPTPAVVEEAVVVEELPATGSEFPLIALGGFIALASAVFVRMHRA